MSCSSSTVKLLTALAVAALVLCAVAARAAAETPEAPEDPNEDPDVLKLTDDNFQDVLGNTAVALVEFYAPWCGHCKSLKPKYQDAAKRLASSEDTKDLKLAKVDATKAVKVAGKFKVDGYPSLKLFRNGDLAEEYDAGRDADAIVAYMKKKGAEPVNKELTTTPEFREATKVANMQGPRLVGVFASKDSVDYKYFKAVAFMFAGSGLEVYHTATPAVLESVGFYGNGCAIHLYRPGAKPNKLTFKGTLFKQDLYDWVLANALPADDVSPYTADLAKLFDKTGDSVVRVITDGSVPTLQAALRDAVAKKTPELRFATAKWSEFEKDAVANCGEASKAQKLCVVAQYGVKAKGKGNAVHGLEEHPFSAATFSAFVDKFVKKQLKQKLKSEPVPAEAPAAGAVTTLVGNTFAERVQESDKSLLIEFYAPWCGHCKALAPKYDELAKALAGDFDKVEIAKIDLTANDLPAEARAAYAVAGFPTLYFAKKGAKAAPLKFEGKREVEDMKKYVMDNM